MTGPAVAARLCPGPREVALRDGGTGRSTAGGARAPSRGLSGGRGAQARRRATGGGPPHGRAGAFVPGARAEAGPAGPPRPPLRPRPVSVRRSRRRGLLARRLRRRQLAPGGPAPRQPVPPPAPEPWRAPRPPAPTAAGPARPRTPRCCTSAAASRWAPS